ncbi:MAG: acetate/propionate family kinase [Elusimicrobia bacterium]|nr:acetate/propionate family kinase [Elusimicrobiota bacterium]
MTDPERILVVNAGTSSLKLRVLGHDDRVLASADLPPVDPGGAVPELDRFVRESAPIGATGHRIVHGGREFRESVVVDDGVLRRLRAVADLAPLHDPPAIAALVATRRLLPGIPHVVCFDTAFHATLPDAAAVYAIPWEWTERYGVRRYGFHGLSHAYVARRCVQLVGRPLAELRIVTCHLGAGASLAAVAGGRSVDTTMGFTPLEGLVMATRSGSIDPGALLWLQERAGLSAAETEEALGQRSGLLGISGLSADMRTVIAAADAGHARATLALGVYVHRLRSAICSMAAAMGGLDVLAFAGGVGEGSARIRRDACDGLGFLGVSLDPQRHEAVTGDDADISVGGATTRALVVHTREDVEIARELRRLL